MECEGVAWPVRPMRILVVASPLRLASRSLTVPSAACLLGPCALLGRRRKQILRSQHLVLLLLLRPSRRCIRPRRLDFWRSFPSASKFCVVLRFWWKVLKFWWSLPKFWWKVLRFWWLALKFLQVPVLVVRVVVGFCFSNFAFPCRAHVVLDVLVPDRDCDCDRACVCCCRLVVVPFSCCDCRPVVVPSFCCGSCLGGRELEEEVFALRACPQGFHSSS